MSYTINIIYKKNKISVNSDGKSTLYDLKRAISKRFGVSSSEMILTLAETRRRINLPDSMLIRDVGFASVETIIVERGQLSPAKGSGAEAIAINFDQVPDHNGLIMVRRVIPADNSCLFNSISYAMENKSRKAAKELRLVVAGYIASEPEKYTEAVLEMSNDVYTQWILDDSNWGGAIELEILARHYGIEIAIVDSQDLSINIFGEGQNAEKRIYLFYSGAHYDIIVRNVSEEMERGTDITVFSTRDQYALEGAMQLAKEFQYNQENQVLLQAVREVDYAPKKISKPVMVPEQIVPKHKKRGFFKKLFGIKA